MAGQRNVSIEISKLLLDQITKRAVINGRKRNAEFRYLLNRGLELAGDNDVQITMKDDDVKSICRIDHEVYGIVSERCRALQRPMGRELVRLVAYAIQVGTNRDLALIEEMMRRQGRGAHEPQSIGPTGSQPFPQEAQPVG